MRWIKQRYNEKANTHRAGWKFWDLVDSEDNYLCMVRFTPDQGYTVIPFFLSEDDDLKHKTTSLKKAQDHAVAYFVNKRLEES